MSFRILVMGLPGSGKSAFSNAFVKILKKHYEDVGYYNASRVREVFDDWDFSEFGRVRQSSRMSKLSDHHDIAVCNFVCPTDMTRKKFNADYVIWMNTIKESKFTDTNQIFQSPKNYNLEITNWNKSAVAMLKALKDIKRRLNAKLD